MEQDGHPAYIADDVSLVRIPGLDEFPLPFTEPGDEADDLEVDGDGNLYVTTFRTNSILKLGPGGQHLDTIDVPLPDRSSITAMEVGLAGEIFIATTASNQVGRVIDLAGLTVFDPFNWQGPSQISAVTFNSVTNEVLAVTRGQQLTTISLRCCEWNTARYDANRRHRDRCRGGSIWKYVRNNRRHR